MDVQWTKAHAAEARSIHYHNRTLQATQALDSSFHIPASGEQNTNATHIIVIVLTSTAARTSRAIHMYTHVRVYPGCVQSYTNI